MGATPQFASTPIAWAGLVPATADASLTAPTNVTTLGTAGASGSKVDEITCQAVATTVDGVVNVFLFDGSTYHLYDQFLVPAVTSSTTAKAWRSSRLYTNLVLPSSSWSLRVTVTVAGLQSLIKVTAIGGSF
jgi:hypothetical protein